MKRMLSLFLIACMLFSMLPSAVFAMEAESEEDWVWTETLTLPVVPADEQLPEPQGYGGGIAMFSLIPNRSEYAYAYAGVSYCVLNHNNKFTFAVEEGVTPTSSGVLQVVDDEGTVLAGSRTVSYYEDYYTPGIWYFYSASFDDKTADDNHQFADIPAGEYTLQIAAGEERYVIDQKLCVVDNESLLINEASISMYYDDQTAEVRMEIFGFNSEEDLAMMSLALTDAEGTTIASSTGEYRDFRYYDNYGYWLFYMELKVADGQTITQGTSYTLTISDTSERMLVDGAGGVISSPHSHSTVLGDVQFSDAQSSILEVELLYPRENTTYDVEICKDYNRTEIYGSWSGIVPGNSLIDISLTQNGMTVSANSYPSTLYVRWKVSDENWWNSESIDNPYFDSNRGSANFYPYSFGITGGQQSFAIELYNFDAYRGDGTDELTMCTSSGEQIASCTSFEEEWNHNWINLTGTLDLPADLEENEYYQIYLNGIRVDNVRTTSGLYCSTRDIKYLEWQDSTYDAYSIWTNFGILPMQLEVLNTSGTARIEFRDETGNVCLTSGDLTGIQGEYTGYLLYDAVFYQADLEEYEGVPLYMYFVDGSNHIYYEDPMYYDPTMSDVVFNNNVQSGDYTVYIDWWDLDAGEQTVTFRIYELRNASEAGLFERMNDLRLQCGDTTIAVQSMSVDAFEDVYSITLTAPVTAGEWSVYDAGVLVYTFDVEVPDAGDSLPHISNNVDTDSWSVWCRNLSQDSEFTAKLYQNYTCITEDAFSLKLVTQDEDDQYLILPKAVVSALDRGEYEIRIYMDDVLLGSASFEAEGSKQPIINILDFSGRNFSDRIIRGRGVGIEVSGSHNWSHFRAAEDADSLEEWRWIPLDYGYGFQDIETVGERTLYVQLSEDESGNVVSEVIEIPFLYLGEDGLMDIYVHEDIEGFYSGDSITLSLGADYPYAYAMVELIDGDGRVQCVPLSYKGKGPLSGPNISVSSEELIGSEHPYTSYMDETWSYTLEGAESIEVTFSENTYVENYYDYLEVYYVDNGEDVLYNRYTGDELAGKTLTLSGDTVKVRLTSDGSGQYYGFSIISVIDPDAVPEEDGEAIPTYHIYAAELDTTDYLGTEKVAFYLVENKNDNYGQRYSLTSEVVERSLVFGNPDAVILPQFDYESSYYGRILINTNHYTLYGYGIPESTVTVTYLDNDDNLVTLGTATAAKNGKFTIELTDLADGIYNFTVLSAKDDSEIEGFGTLEVDTVPPTITAMGFTFSDDDTATLSWTCQDSDLDNSVVYLITETGERRLATIYANQGSDGVYSITVTASNNDGQCFKVQVEDIAGNTAFKTISTSDEEAPTAPGELTYTERTASSVTLNWTAGDDNVGVAGYNIYCNGTKIGQTTGTDILEYEATDLEQGTEYTFSVLTRDLAENLSSESNPELTVSTAKLSVEEEIDNTVSTGGENTVDVKVTATLKSDAADYIPAVNDFIIRYQINDGENEPDENRWIEQSLDNLFTSGSKAEGTWKIALPEDTELPLTCWVQVVVSDYEDVIVYSDVNTLTLVEGRVTFTVKDSKTAEIIPGAKVSVYQNGELKYSGTSNSTGKVMLNLEDGNYSLIAMADGYQMRSISSVNISDDRLEFTVYMNTEDILEVQTTVKEMTYDEIVAAGIDPSAAGNKHVYQCTAILQFGERIEIDYICAGNEVIKGEPKRTDKFVIYPAAKDIFLIIPTETTWLKEMFDVQLLVTNSSAFEDIENCVAELYLPNGLSLADMSVGAQSETAVLGTITPGGSASHHWYVRGDKEGYYTLQGNVTGDRVGGGLSEEITVGFKTQDPIYVLAGSAMKLTIEAEKTATIGVPYNVRFTLQNVSSKNLYNVNFEVLGGTFRQAYSIDEVLADYDLEGPFQADANNGNLANGFILSAAQFEPADVLSGVFTITFGSGISDPEAVEYMLKQVFLFTGAGSTTEIPTEVIWVDSVSEHIHTYDDGVVDPEPTCTEAGVKTFTCTDEACGASFTIVLDATGHNMNSWTVVEAATCTESGSAQSKCTNAGCDYTENKILNPLDHNFSEDWTIDTEATCTEKGSKSHHCTRTGCDAKSDVTEIPEKGHAFGDWGKYSETQHKRICTIETCRFEEFADHEWDDGVVTAEPTHFEYGVKTYTCTICNETKTEAMDKLPDHIWSEWEPDTDTHHKRECECGSYETAEHNWNDGVVTKEPTHFETGVKTYTCGICDETKTEAMDKLPGHSWGEWKPDTDTHHKRECACGSYETAEHDWSDGVMTKEPTLEENGEKTYTCTVCGATKIEKMNKLQLQEMYFSVNLLDRDMVKTYGDPSFVDMLFNGSVEEPEVTYTSSDENVATVAEDGYVTIKGAGTATITATSAAVPYQYAETTASYKLIVNKAELTVTAKDQAIAYGVIFVPNGYTADGFVYGETAEVLSGEAAYTCDYEQYGNAGEYAIDISGFTSNNYNITFVPGKLTVGKTSEYSIAFGNLRQKSDNITAVTANVTPEDDSAVIKLEYKVNDQWTADLPTGVGTYPVRAMLIESANIVIDEQLYGDQLVIEATDSIGGVSVSVKTDEEKEEASVEVTEEELADIVESLEDSNGDLAINLESVEKDTLVLPGNLIEALDKSDDLETVTVTTGNSSISMSDTVLNTIADAMDEDDTVALKMTTKSVEELDQAQKDALESIGGPSPKTVVLELKLAVTDADGNEKGEIKNLGGNVDITIQCDQEMQSKNVVACYISPDGTVTYLVAKYDEATNTLSFKTNHFSIYAAIVLSQDMKVVYVVDENGMELPAVGSGPQTIGESVTVEAPAAPAGYVFSEWKVVEGALTLTDASSASITFVMPGEDVILKATYKVKGNDYSDTYLPNFNLIFLTHSVKVNETGNGIVALNNTTALEGSIMTVSIKPDSGYELEELLVLDKYGREVRVTKKSDTKYTFIMPASDVVVTANFVETAVMDDTTETDSEPVNPFNDIKDSEYYYEAVLWAVEKGITTGTSDVTFGPNDACTRAQTVTFIWRAAGCPEPKTTANPFADVAADAYYYDAVLWAYENGITAGTTATTFSPNATVTRAQTVTFLWRWAGKPAAGKNTSFNDVAAAAYYHDAVVWAAENGVTSGTSAVTFSPDNHCLRSQIVTFLYRFIKG